MNIEPDIFDYLQTTALEPHDDYTSQITYKDQKIIWNRLKQQEKQLNKQKEILDKIKKYVKNLLKEEFEITDPDNINYGEKCQRAYFSDSELIKILELLEEIE